MELQRPRDRLQRPLKDLRVSVTDRCNYRCGYCMPLEDYDWMQRGELLTFEEITRLTRLFVRLGVEKVRLTGGEPLLRNDLETLVAQLARLDGLRDLAMTTNGAGLETRAQALRDAGLQRLNVSLDSLRPERFRAITKRGCLDHVLQGIAAARAVGISPIKINAVIMRGTNDDEIIDLVEFCRERDLGLRFIEYMDVGNANGWTLERTVTQREILQRIRAHYRVVEVGREEGRAPAFGYALGEGEGGVSSLPVGVIGSITEPFCSSCVRARLTADGKLVTCLFASDGVDLKTPLRDGATDQELLDRITAIWSRRDDRFSDERWEAIRSGKDYRPKSFQKIEMISLGG